MQGYRGHGETKRGGGIQKLLIVAFHKNCKWNLLFILILRDRCVIHLLCCCCYFFVAKIGKNGIEQYIRALLNCNSLNVVVSLKKGRFICGFRYPISDLIQKTVPTAHASRTDLLTNWLTDYQTKLINEWLNE